MAATKPSDSVVEAICEQIELGLSQTAACRSQGVDESTFRSWKREFPDIDTRYVRARDDRAHLWAEQFIEIADNPVEGMKTTTKADGSVETVTGDMIEHRKLQLDARKWIVSRILPKQYGDKVQQEHSGAVGVQLVNDIPRPKRG